MFPVGVQDKAFASFYARVNKVFDSLATLVDQDKDGTLLAQARADMKDVQQVSFRDAVLEAWRPNQPLDRMSESTSGYCQARQRLPDRVAQGVLQLTVRALQEELGEAALWHGRWANVFEGSTLVERHT